MSDYGERYPLFLFDPDNIANILYGNFTAYIDNDGKEVKIPLDSGVLVLKSIGNLDFMVKWLVGDVLKCIFLGHIQMEDADEPKYFFVHSLDMSLDEGSATDGVKALRQILQDDNIDGRLLNRYSDDADGYDDDAEGSNDAEEQSDPAQNLAGRFADAAGDAEGYDDDGDLFADVVDDTSGQV